MSKDMQERVTEYLTDAHSLEEQALQQLRRAPENAGDAALAAALRQHAVETETHERRVRKLLEQRRASPSLLKDAVMKAGGEAFVLFARLQPDTPGKLASHALSYEALEWAAYDLLGRTAERAGEPEVTEAARSIREEERAMIGRLEGLFDSTVESSLRDLRPQDLQEQLKKYLADAHALEEQSIQLLRSGREMLDHPTLERLFGEHLAESLRQQELLEERLAARGGEPSLIKDAAMRFGALNWGMFFGSQPDTPLKLMAFAYAFEHLEIGGYEQLRRVADRAGDGDTVGAAQRILRQERDAARKLSDAFDEAVSATIDGS